VVALPSPPPPPPASFTQQDRNGLPVGEGQEVQQLWYSSDGAEHSAKLAGSLEGAERRAWWDDKLAFKFDEPDEDGAAPTTAPTVPTVPTAAATSTADSVAADGEAH
jgi:hypothetical protein